MYLLPFNFVNHLALVFHLLSTNLIFVLFWGFFFLKECLKERLQQRGYQKEEVDGQLRLVRRFLSEKICDIKRKVNINLEVRFV